MSTITEIGPSVTFDENTVNATPAIIDGDVIVGAAGTFDGGNLTVSGLLAEDTVAIRNTGTGDGEIGVSGNDVTYGGAVIGTVSGGAGSDLVVTFNANATQAAVEVLVENLTYANSSDSPTASRTLSVSISDSTNGYVEQAGTANPFAGINTGYYATPTLGDIDGDGDLDLLTGDYNDGLSLFLNIGTLTAPVYDRQTGADNPLDGHGVASHSPFVAPTFVDLDGDGDLDVVVGNSGSSKLLYFENTGTATAPAYVQRTGTENPLDGLVASEPPSPTFADLDNDGDLDLITGLSGGQFQYFENTGSANAAAFAEQTGTDSPFNGIDIGDLARPAFADLDGDGDLDMVVGDIYGSVLTFDNTGKASTPSFVELTGADNSFAGIDVGNSTWGNAAPTFADLDDDGDLDLAVGDYDGEVHAYENNSPAKSTITINVTAENEIPVATDGSDSTDENTAVDGAVPTATDSDGTITSYALVSDVSKGDLTFNSDGTYSFDPNAEFEALADGESEQVSFTYHVVDNDGAQSVAKTVTITVNGADETGGGGGGTTNDVPEITSAGAFKIAENTTSVGKITASDSDDTPVFSIAGGADAFLFKIDARTGALSFKASPDFEEPGDADGNNTYQVQVRASDGTATDTEVVTVTVTNESGVTINGSKKEDTVSGSTTVKGQSPATNEEDTILGKGGNDKLSGLGGNDTLDGGKGNDKLTGGEGNDSFVFNKKLSENVDKVKDFGGGIDTIVLDDKVFKKLSPGELSAEEFVVGKKAKDGSDHVIYNQKNGQLLYDKDGKGGQDAVVFAKAGKGLDIDAGDFLVI